MLVFGGTTKLTNPTHDVRKMQLLQRQAQGKKRVRVHVKRKLQFRLIESQTILRPIGMHSLDRVEKHFVAQYDQCRSVGFYTRKRKRGCWTGCVQIKYLNGLKRFHHRKTPTHYYPIWGYYGESAYAFRGVRYYGHSDDRHFSGF